jgi:hypothetical protein
MRIKEILTGLIFLSSVCSAAPPPIDVGDRKQLFIDNRFITESEDITLTVNPPSKAGIAIKRDKPWESHRMDAGMVIQHEGKVRCYYTAFELDKKGKPGKSYPCYAESKDGINWKKPSLGLVEYQGSKNNNILPLIGNVYFDPKAAPEKKYKCLALCGNWKELDSAGLYLYYSGDGIEWEKNPTRLFPFEPDGTNQIVYDPSTDKYIAYFRQWFPRSSGTIFDSKIKPLRTIGMVILDDPDKPWPYDVNIPPFHLWGSDIMPTPSAEFEVALACDEKDPPETDIYCAGISRYEWAEDVWVAFPAMYRHFSDPSDKFINDGIVDAQLAVSRDGRNWTRFRQPYIRLGLAGTMDNSKQIYVSIGLVRNGNEIYQYYGGMPLTHGEIPGKPGDAEAYRVIQRLDGFVSADAPYQGGQFITPQIVFTGSKLQINVDTSALGQVQVEILGPNNKRIQGFTLAEADLIQGNFTDKIVAWNESVDINHLAGRSIKLRFVMRSAKLYAFQFVK